MFQNNRIMDVFNVNSDLLLTLILFLLGDWKRMPTHGLITERYAAHALGPTKSHNTRIIRSSSPDAAPSSDELLEIKRGLSISLSDKSGIGIIDSLVDFFNKIFFVIILFKHFLWIQIAKILRLRIKLFLKKIIRLQMFLYMSDILNK